MDYAGYGEREGMAGWKKALLIGVLVIVVPVLLLIGVGVFIAATQTPEQRFDREVESNQNVASFAKPLKQYYPIEYDRMRRAALAAEKQGVAAISTAGEDFFAGFMKRHADEAVHAPDDKLAAYLAALGTAYAHAAKDGKTCAALLGGRSQEAVGTGEASVQVFGKVAATYVEAAAAGRDKPAVRRAVNDADKLAVQTRLRAFGFTPLDLRVVGNRQPNPADPTRACRVMDALVQVISAMPPDQKSRLTVLFAEQT